VDVLADLLAATQLTGDVFSHTLCDPPWGLRYAPAGHVWFHIIAHGTCRLLPDGDRARQLATHDLVMLPHGTGHALCDDPESVCVDADPEWVRAQPRPLMLTTRRLAGSGRRGVHGGARCEIMCGNYTVASPRTHPVLRLLPKVIHVPGREIMTRADLHATMQLILREFSDNDVGSQIIVPRLLEVLFVQVLRHWLDTRPVGEHGWLGALRDEPIGNALGLMHASPARAWTVRSLARSVGLSRPVFARRFTERVGDTPMGYLRGVRVERAARLLVETADSLAAIATAVGYTSEYAFNRAFRRARGVPPGRFRVRALDSAR